MPGFDIIAAVCAGQQHLVLDFFYGQIEGLCALDNNKAGTGRDHHVAKSAWDTASVHRFHQSLGPHPCQPGGHPCHDHQILITAPA